MAGQLVDFLNPVVETQLVYASDGGFKHFSLSGFDSWRCGEISGQVREYPAWQQKRHRNGRWWMVSLGCHVPFESWVERDYLLNLDFQSAGVDRIVAQPLQFIWPDSAPREHHVPDYLVFSKSDPVLLVDVRLKTMQDEAALEQFALTQDACDVLGWNFEVFGGLDDVRKANLLLLHKYSLAKHWAPPERVSDAIQAGFSAMTPIEDVLDAISVFQRVPKPRLLGHVYYMLWHHQLVTDLNFPLVPEREVVAA